MMDTITRVFVILVLAAVTVIGWAISFAYLFPVMKPHFISAALLALVIAVAASLLIRRLVVLGIRATRRIRASRAR